MKKLLVFSILTYLVFTLNSNADNSTTIVNNTAQKKVLNIGVLLPLTGKHGDLGESFLKAIQMALYDIDDENIKIYVKDSKANALDSYNASRDFEKLGVTIVIGPIFYESLERLNEVNNITFISLSNKTKKIPNNVIAFGINIKSQIKTLEKYFKKIKISKTLLLSPRTKFIDQGVIVKDSDLKFSRVFFYDTNPKKITAEIEKLTKYHERRKNLERRVKILENSNLYKDKKELKELEQKHTLGAINFDSVLILDFDERLKSVLTSFMFSDISNEKVYFFALNQWFDATLFKEAAIKNLYFPGINLKNLKKFKKKYLKIYNKKPNEVSILAYDALGLIYYCWKNNNYEFKANQLFDKKGFKGLHGEFTIINNFSNQKLKIYKVDNNNFVEVY